MELPNHLTNVLRHEGVVAIATHGPQGLHLVNTWNSYIHATPQGDLLVPVGGMHRTEANLAGGGPVLVTVGTREEQGFHGAGTGCLIQGQARMVDAGPDFDQVKARFPWARAVLAITPENVTQTL
jgi:hypothetical protein